ncbi:hypothetical protein BDQ12DRAFT_574684, partial [Crucibulum laeve]
IDILSKKVVHGAFQDSNERFDAPKCHPKTRIVILKKILDWAEAMDKSSRIMWMYGPAGSGKSAIAQTTAETFDGRRLAATFFFSRKSADRSSAKHLLTTIAYQMAISIPGMRSLVEQVVENDHSVFSRSLETQFRRLVINPFMEAMSRRQETMNSHLIIIDGLDECRDALVQGAIIKLFASFFTQYETLPLTLLIASRPERQIRDVFNIEDVNRISLRLVLDDTYNPDSDIKEYLQSKFSEIKQIHPLKQHIDPKWPSENIISQLVRKSSGQFIYASTAIKFISSLKYRPSERLDIILGNKQAGDETPFAHLDSLYMYTLA